MIIECILTTTDQQGRVNCAPMGVEWGDKLIVIKPYQDTTTYRNLVATGIATVNLTDNVLLFAQSAISDPVFETVPATMTSGVVLKDVCSWREVEIQAVDNKETRAKITTRVVYSGYARDFLGFNRARYAVLEAAILATRTRFLPAEHILAEFERLQVIVDKTAGAREHEAMQLLTNFIQEALRPTS
jgi:hypothetical protein